MAGGMVGMFATLCAKDLQTAIALLPSDLPSQSCSLPASPHEAELHQFLWKPAADPALTRGFGGFSHDHLLRLLREKADNNLVGKPRIVLVQSLQDAGCDLVIEWGDGSKYGIQLKSHGDIGEKDFAPKTVAQIQDSRRHGLRKLYVLLAGDLTDHSQVEKLRGFEARVSQQNDNYVVTISPERLWTLLFQ